jgi:hypothetical protein
MRRLHLSWVLPLLLVFAQHGAVLHELSHFHHVEQSQSASLSANLDVLDNGPCLTCEAFAQVASPAASNAQPLAVCRTTFLPVADPCYRIVTAETPTPRSRGPPQA